MPLIKQRVLLVRNRQQRQWLLRCISIATFASTIAAFALTLAFWSANETTGWKWVAALLCSGPIIGAIYATIRARNLRDAAVAIDRTFQLKDRTQTALNFLEHANPTTLHRLQIEDAESHLSTLDPKSVPVAFKPQFIPATVVFAVATLLLLALTRTTPEAVASVVQNETVMSVAQQVEEHIKELDQFEQEESDQEVAELVKELKAQVEALKEMNVDPKEALAKLSEMEASLKEMQKQLEAESEQAQLEKIGEALSLSEEMAAAGQAMANGEMQKAAEELAKLEMPKLDMKTEKAITEKLEQIANQNQDKAPSKSTKLKEATQQVNEGLASGNKSKFSDGVQGLAGECNSQGRKKKLNDLLKKQCQCLSECKGECEGQCKSDTPKKGGSKAGIAASGNETGDKTAKLKASPKMDIKGQDSGQGDIDVETEESEAQEQQVAREYRKKVDKYEAMSESVLESESIPLGQRQTIRRYFESIRPQEGEQEAVDKAIAPAEDK